MKLENLSPNLRGAVFLMMATAGFSLVAVFIKLLGGDIPIVQIVLIRQAILTVLLIPAIRDDGVAILRSKRYGLHCARVVGALVSMLLSYAAVVNMPLADATAIGFAKAFFLTIFAVLILRETVGVYRWSAVAVGFLGVVIMLQPGGAGFSIWSMAALVSAAVVGLVMVFVRLLTREDSTRTVMAWQAVGVGAVVLPFGVAFWVWPTPEQWALLGAMGVVSFLAQRTNIDAYRVGEASLLASLDYVRLLYAALLGFVIFGELPSLQTWLGAGIIVLAALFTVYREQRLNRALLRDSASASNS